MVIENKNNKFSVVTQKIQTRFLPYRACLSLKTLKTLNLYPGQPVLIQKGEISQACASWPCPSLRDNDVALSSLLCENLECSVGEEVDIMALETPIPEASMISLDCENGKSLCGEMNDEFFKIFLKDILLDYQYISVGQFIEFKYLERGYRMIISNVKNTSKRFNPSSSKYLDKSSKKDGMEFDLFYVTKDSKIEYQKKDGRLSKINYKSIGGLEKEIRLIKEAVEIPLLNPKVYLHFSLSPPKGLLLHGPPGTGKTMLARAVAHETGAHFIVVNGPEIISKHYGESEDKLKTIFQEASENSPSIIFLDEIDALCPSREETSSEMQKRIVASLLSLMDGCEPLNSVVVIAATNRPNAIDPALRRPGRFDREIEIGVPNQQSRYEILKLILSKIPNNIEDSDLKQISDTTHGYVGADLTALCREACLNALKNNVDKDLKTISFEELSETVLVSLNDLKIGKTIVSPSAMREVALQIPSTKWEDIGGSAIIKKKLQEAVSWPLKYPDTFKRLGISKPPKGVLLYGPPGCSKTLLAKALACESGVNFFSVKGPELFSKYVGDTERSLKALFKKARTSSPSLIFFDEIDALAIRRGSSGESTNSVSDRLLTQLLVELDGVESLESVIIVAATNRPDVLDEALLRPGRLDRLIYVPPPDLEARIEILEIAMKDMPVAVDKTEIALKAADFSGAELVSLCTEAAYNAMSEDIENVSLIKDCHFQKAFKTVKPRITRKELDFYENFQKIN
jgi:SpoVK/Ycf46/Vps4 family AAA+-type ATPase